jgi:hypothetical protein
MTKPIIKIHNIETGEELERQMTDAEFAQYEADQAASAVKAAEAEAKAVARQAILDRLGLTEEEARLLLG